MFFLEPEAGALDGCEVDGTPSIGVPDVRGLALGDAVDALRAAGLHVAGAGVPEGDPTDPDALVVAQEPPAGSLVVAGACVGMRTAG